MSQHGTTFHRSQTAPTPGETIFAGQACSRQLFWGNEEPLLDEVLVDPLVHRLMERDGVRMEALLLLIGETQKQLS